MGQTCHNGIPFTAGNPGAAKKMVVRYFAGHFQFPPL